MRSLSASELLDAWESGLVQAPVQRALTLLAAGHPDNSIDDLAVFSIGHRDACLLEFRERMFGPQLVCLARCPACGERLEASFRVSDIRAPSQIMEPAILSLRVDDFEVRFRAPNSLDLLAVSGNGDVLAVRDDLFNRCVLSIHQDGTQKTIGDLSPMVVDEIIERIGKADPQADVELGLLCPSCANEWCEGFDIVSFFWSEINAWAQRILRDVHTLATAYGWRESEILALSPGRRQVYLAMVGQ